MSGLKKVIIAGIPGWKLHVEYYSRENASDLGIFHPDGTKVRALKVKGRVMKAIVSDDGRVYYDKGDACTPLLEMSPRAGAVMNCIAAWKEQEAESLRSTPHPHTPKNPTIHPMKKAESLPSLGQIETVFGRQMAWNGSEWVPVDLPNISVMLKGRSVTSEPVVNDAPVRFYNVKADGNYEGFFRHSKGLVLTDVSDRKTAGKALAFYNEPCVTVIGGMVPQAQYDALAAKVADLERRLEAMTAASPSLVPAEPVEWRQGSGVGFDLPDPGNPFIRR